MRANPLHVRSSAAITLLIALSPAAAWAHYPWLTPETFTPSAGEALSFQVGWGHAFPSGGVLPAERIEAATLIGPEGAEQAVSIREGEMFRTHVLASAGSYLLAATQRRGYYSRTPQGGRQGSRAEHPDALSCGYSANFMKAVIGVPGDGATGRVLGHTLEIIPIEAPSGLAAEERLQVRVLLRGQPFRGTVNAVYAGFEGGEEVYPVSVDTDEQGLARIPIDRADTWLIMVSASEPFENTSVCDRHNYTATLTFAVHRPVSAGAKDGVR